MAQALQKQLEFYFSDSNYPRDKFMRAHAAKSEEGYIPLEVFLTFNKIKENKHTLEDLQNAAAASEQLALSEDKNQVRRLAPLPTTDIATERSVYVFGLPTGVTLEEIAESLSTYKVLSLRAVRAKEDKKKTEAKDGETATDSKKRPAPATDAAPEEKKQKTETEGEQNNKENKGHFIEFADLEQAKQFIDTKPKVNGIELTNIQDKMSYLKPKKEKKEKPAKDNNKKDREAKKEEPFTWTPGVLVNLEGANDIDLESRELARKIKDEFAQFGKVAFVEKNADGQIIARFSTPEDAQKSVAGTENGEFTVAEKKIKAVLLTGEQEEAQWKRVEASMKERQSSRGGRGGRGGRGRGRGGRGKGRD